MQYSLDLRLARTQHDNQMNFLSTPKVDIYLIDIDIQPASGLDNELTWAPPEQIRFRRLDKPTPLSQAQLIIDVKRSRPSPRPPRSP